MCDDFNRHEGIVSDPALFKQGFQTCQFHVPSTGDFLQVGGTGATGTELPWDQAGLDHRTVFGQELVIAVVDLAACRWNGRQL